MAEYIDRNEVLNYRETVITDDYSGNETLEVVSVEEILGLTPADVIERKKIDKAIEEIESQQKFNIECDGESDLGIAIQIIKKHLGEVEE